MTKEQISQVPKTSIGDILMHHNVTPLAELVDDLEDFFEAKHLSISREGQEGRTIGFAEWASLHCFNKFTDGQWFWGYKEKYHRLGVGWLTTKQLFQEFKTITHEPR